MTEEITTRKAAWPRYVLGGGALLLGLIGFVWTMVAGYVDVKLRVLPTQLTRENESQFMARYMIELERLLNLDPSNGFLRSVYVQGLARQGQYRQAVAEFNEARKTQNAQNSLFFLADMYEKMGEIDKAEATMAECLKINPTDRLFNPARLRLLNKRVLDMKAAKKAGQPVDAALYDTARREYGLATINWFIRAPHDKNSYLFYGNYNIEPLYPLQAYRSFLLGLSQNKYMNLNEQMMIQPQMVLGTIRQIIQGRFAKPYLNLP